MLKCYKDYSFLFGDFFLISIVLFLASVGLVVKLYHSPAPKDSEQITWGILLILCSSALAFGLAYLAESIERYKSSFNYECSEYLIYTSISIEYSKYIISFGLAAIGAGITSNVLTERFSIKKNKATEGYTAPIQSKENKKNTTDRNKLIEKSELYFKKSLKNQD